jgi:hypothetical protein
MVQFTALISIVFLACGISALPQSAPTQNSTAPTDNLTLDDIINKPVVAPPLADTAFTPIVAASNKTLVDTNPNIQAKIDNLPSVVSSISAAAATATSSATPTEPTPSPPSKIKRTVVNTSPPSANYVRP